jgi:ABC-type phosphate transport system permease subunit
VEHGSTHFGALIATGVVLFVFILIINTLFSILNADKKDKKVKRKKTEAEGIV